MIEILGSSAMYVVMGIIVVAVASLFGLVVFASKEEKFEDVVAAQKREQEALLQSLNATTSKPSKSKKKWAKIKSQKAAKSGEKKDVQNEPEADRAEENVSEASPEVVLPKTESKEKNSTKKRKSHENKTKRDAPPAKILEELIEQAEFQFDRQEPQTVVEPEKKPKQESNKKNATKNMVSEIVAEIKETAEMNQPPPVVEEKEKSTTTVANQKKKAKKAKTQASSNEDKILADKIAKELENSQFNAPDVQRLIDILLDKQNELQQWQMPNKKTDVVEDLRNKCHVLEEQLNEEKKTCLSAAHENKDLRLEIQHERSQFQKFQTQANQKIAQQGGEIQALQKRMEMTQETHLHEMQNGQHQLQQLKEVIEQSSPVDMQRLKEENVMLKNASIITQKLTDEKNSLVAEYSQVQQASKNLRAELDSALMQLQQHKQQMQLYEEQNKAHENEIQKLRVSKNDTEKVLSARAAELKDQLLRYEMEHKNLQQQFQMAQQQVESTKLERENLVTKSADSSMLEQKLSSSMKEIENLTSSLKSSEEKLKQYQEVELKNMDLLKQLAEEKQQLQDRIKQDKDEMVIVEKLPSNGLSNDAQVSNEEHHQLITEKDKVIFELKEDVKSTKEELERLEKVLHHEKHEKDEAVKILENAKHDLEHKLDHMGKDLAEGKAEKKKLEEIVEQSKTKNNDLREKNWKAMDALSTAEANAKKKVKETEESVFRVLKKMRPSIKLEKNRPLETVLHEYQEAFLRKEEEQKESEKNTEELDTITNERDALKSENKELNEKLNEFKNTETTLNNKLEEATKSQSSCAENIKKLSEDSKKANMQIEHYKEVLQETEGMLKKLQAGVESQVANYEKKITEKDQKITEKDQKITEKDVELKQLKEKTIRLDETLKNNDDKTQLELDLKKIQNDFESERKAKLDLESELEEARKKMTDFESHLEISQSEDSLAQSQESLNSGVGSSSPKKKKGFRHAFSKAFHKKSVGDDDAKNQLSAVQEHLSKIEAEKTELAKKLGSVSDDALAKDEEIKKMKESKEHVDKELAKLKEKLSIVDNIKKDSGKSDKEKDKIIAKLTLENAELREDLRDERDRVVVDVESADSEQLKSDLSSLQQKYEEEMNSSKKLNTSLHELEEQLEMQKTEVEKKNAELAELERKYKEAADEAVVNEQKIQELELAGLTKSERIQLEIDEAINQSGNSPTSPQRTIGAPLLEQLEEVKNNLSQLEKEMETEKLTNKQLRAQLATYTSHASHGTSV